MNCESCQSDKPPVVRESIKYCSVCGYPVSHLPREEAIPKPSAKTSFTRIVIYEAEWGVFLGSWWGFGFWSKLDPAGQEYACVFDSVEEAGKFVASWESTKSDPARAAKIEYREVLISDGSGHHASIAELVRAGLPAWDPNTVSVLWKAEDASKFN